MCTVGYFSLECSNSLKHILSPTQKAEPPRAPVVHGTYFDRKSRWEFQFDEISQPCKMSTSSGHQVNDGNDLLHERERKFLTHPQRCFKPAGFDRDETEGISTTQGHWILYSKLDNTSFLTPQVPIWLTSHYSEPWRDWTHEEFRSRWNLAIRKMTSTTTSCKSLNRQEAWGNG